MITIATMMQLAIGMTWQKVALSAQISASKFQNLSQIALKICGVWLKTHSKFWKLTQIFGEQFKGIEG